MKNSTVKAIYLVTLQDSISDELVYRQGALLRDALRTDPAKDEILKTLGEQVAAITALRDQLNDALEDLEAVMQITKIELDGTPAGVSN